MPPKVLEIARRRFELADQLDFAALSEDHNPMHVDPLAARRTQAGAPVVHGLHATLWALEALLASKALDRPIAGLRASFQKFIYVGDEVSLRVAGRSDDSLHAELSTDGLKTSELVITYGAESAQRPELLSSRPIDVSKTPVELDVADMREAAGWFPPSVQAGAAERFPLLCAFIGADRVVALARLSALVGMVCPGLHSIFGEFDVRFGTRSPDTTGLSFATRSASERYRIVKMDVAGSGLTGTVLAFARQAPVLQPSNEIVARSVRAGEFAGITALVVGGSRGLGALTAKIVAAGGGRVAITYRVGENDALAILAEIGAERCKVLHYDAVSDARAQLAQLDWKIDQLYYFATTPIYRAQATIYSNRRFEQFCRIYVSGFAAVCETLLAGNPDGLSAFYPSTVFVAERPPGMAEYAMAKAAGEVLCEELQRELMGLRIVVSRLPRLLTDQTATITASKNEDAIEVLVAAVRAMTGPLPGPR